MSHIAGRSILVIEDEPLVALDIMETFERVGAHVQLAPTRSSALERMGPEVAAAVLDFGLNFGDGHPLVECAPRHPGSPDVDRLVGAEQRDGFRRWNADGTNAVDAARSAGRHEGREFR